MKRSITFLTSVLFLVFCFSASLSAQETGGEIQGTVKDPAGAVVPNATITIVGMDIGFNRTIQTDEDGFYRARQIPPGAYKVSVASTGGFAAQTKENVQVVLGNVTTLDISLGAAVGAVVDVTDDPGVVVDTTETKAQDNLSARDIDVLPKGTTFSSLLNKTSQVRSDAISGQFTINGATGPENSFIIDGQEVQNFRTGVLTEANDIPFTSVQELQVRTSGFEAEFGGATGGVITLVTPGGSNDLHGTAGMQFGIPKLNGQPRPILSTITGLTTPSTTFTELLPQEKDRGTLFFPTVSLGGAIVKDRAWFFLNYSPQITTTQRTTSYFTQALPQNRVLQPGENPVVSHRKQTREYAFLRFDVSPFDSLRLTSSYTWNPIAIEGAHPTANQAFTNVPSAVLGGVLYSGRTYFDQLGGRQNSNNLRVEGVWTPSGKLVVLGRYTRGFLNEILGAYGVPNTTRFQCRFTATATHTVAQLESLAGCVSGFQNVTNNDAIGKDVSIRTTAEGQASYLINSFGGRHELKGGYQYSTIFNDVQTGWAETGVVRLCYGRFVGGACLGVPEGGSFNISNAPLGFGQLYRFGALGSATNTAHTMFIQDKWQPVNRLTLNLGVRAEQEKLPAFNGFDTNLKFDFTEKLAPRIGAAYDLTGDGKTKISAFYGWFYDRLKFELPRGSFGGNFFYIDNFAIDPAHPEYSYYTPERVLGSVGTLPGGACPTNASQTGFVVTRCQLNFRLPSNVPGFADLIGPDAPEDAGTVDPNLKPYRQTEFTVEFQREVMRTSVFTARFLYRNLDSVTEDSGFLTPAGSEFYDIANPCEGMHLKHSEQFGFQNCQKPVRNYKALQLDYDTRFIKNFSLNLNYTWSRLYGNYSGLANPEEFSLTTGIGRNSPGVTRAFDLPFVAFNAAGKPDLGLLPLDRTHVFKASGTYSFNWWGSKTNTTDMTFFTTAQSGTPQTTLAPLIYHIEIPVYGRGDLGRTEMFTQTDVSFTHRYRFGRDNRFTMAFDLNILNLFDEKNVILRDPYLNGVNFDVDYHDIANGTFLGAVNKLTTVGIQDDITKLNGTPQSNPSNYSTSYGQPMFFQGPRNIRFGLRLQF